MAKLGSSTSKLDKTWELQATVLEKFTGVGKNGENYYRVKIGGFTFFNEDLYHQTNEGDKVILSGEYIADRYNRASGAYTPQFELEGVVTVNGGFADPPTMAHVNGNGKLEKAMPN